MAGAEVVVVNLYGIAGTEVVVVALYGMRVVPGVVVPGVVVLIVYGMAGASCCGAMGSRTKRGVLVKTAGVGESKGEERGA